MCPTCPARSQARGRAFETVIGIAVANYLAPRCDGHCFAVDPSGRIIAMASDLPGFVVRGVRYHRDPQGAQRRSCRSP
jgi:predicted amidohydrolase